MYILESGHCEVLVKGPLNKKESFVRDINPGELFGEVALLFGTRRTASVRSKDHCTVAVLSDEIFYQMLENFPELKLRLKKYSHQYNDPWKEYKMRAIFNIDYFSNLERQDLDLLHHKLEFSNYEAGAKVFSLGTNCHKMYLIVKG